MFLLVYNHMKIRTAENELLILTFHVVLNVLFLQQIIILLSPLNILQQV